MLSGQSDADLIFFMKTQESLEIQSELRGGAHIKSAVNYSNTIPVSNTQLQTHLLLVWRFRSPAPHLHHGRPEARGRSPRRAIDSSSIWKGAMVFLLGSQMT